MPTLHVRNVPESLYARLQQQARSRSRSLSAEVITLLDQALQEEDSRQAQISILADIRRRRSIRKPDPKMADSVVLLRADRKR
jgi:antitoxin FitA